MGGINSCISGKIVGHDMVVSSAMMVGLVVG
jgi:hypothetical protein